MDFGTATLQRCNTFTHNPLVINRKDLLCMVITLQSTIPFCPQADIIRAKIAPKSPSFCPLSWLKKASFLPHFRPKTHQNRPKTRRKTPKSKPLRSL